MSAEAFQTVLSCDCRTAPDGCGVQYARSGTGQPRWTWGATQDRDPAERPWADCYQYAEHVVRIAADAVHGEEMDGITGDHPHKRAHVAQILQAAADLVRTLALDAAGDATLTPERWEQAVDGFALAADQLRQVEASHAR